MLKLIKNMKNIFDLLHIVWNLILITWQCANGFKLLKTLYYLKWSKTPYHCHILSLEINNKIKYNSINVSSPKIDT